MHIQEARSKALPGSRITLGRRFQRMLWHFICRLIMHLFSIGFVIAGWVGRRRRPIASEGCEIMLSGRFDSSNWIENHLRPMSASRECAGVCMVSSNPVPAIPKVEAIYPPPWLVKTTGTKLSQFLTFIFAAVKRQPDIVGGFHMMPHGAAAAVASRLTGARSMYFSVGGPAEIRDGGVHSSDSPFNKMETPDAVVEDRFLNLIGNFDTIITMGSGAINYLLEKGIETDYHVAAGGIDAERFKPNESATSIDIILTGRLTYIKRLDIFLSAIRKVADELPEVRVVIVGSGELQADLMQAALTLGIDDNVHFAGYQENVEDWLSRSKIFVLTSDSEGLALSMMEAMMSGLPAVVSDVGDLGDLVESGVNGYLVPRRSPQLFADRLIELLSDRQKLHAFSQAARRSALRYETQATIEKWDMIFSRYR